jgi:hypothetical protein
MLPQTDTYWRFGWVIQNTEDPSLFLTGKGRYRSWGDFDAAQLYTEYKHAARSLSWFSGGRSKCRVRAVDVTLNKASYCEED